MSPDDYLRGKGEKYFSLPDGSSIGNQ